MISTPTGRNGSGQLPLLAYAALYFPEEKLRRRIRRGLERWARDMAPTVSDNESRLLLGSSSGTPIEPFELDDDERWLAALLVRVARGGAAGIPAVRIQGRDNLGMEGGLVVRTTGEPRFSERLATGVRVDVPPGTLVFRPGRAATPQRLRSEGQADCWLRHSRDGIEIRLEPVPAKATLRFHGDPAQTAHWEPLGVRGLELRLTHGSGRSGHICDSLLLQARTPESMLRLSSLLARERVVAVHGPQAGSRYALLVRLAFQDAEEHPLRSLSSWPLGALERWLEARSPLALDDRFVPGADRVALSRWLAPPSRWLSTKLVEEVV